MAAPMPHPHVPRRHMLRTRVLTLPERVSGPVSIMDPQTPSACRLPKCVPPILHMPPADVDMPPTPSVHPPLRATLPQPTCPRLVTATCHWPP